MTRSGDGRTGRENYEVRVINKLSVIRYRGSVKGKNNYEIKEKLGIVLENRWGRVKWGTD